MPHIHNAGRLLYPNFLRSTVSGVNAEPNPNLVQFTPIRRRLKRMYNGGFCHMR